MCSKRSRCQHDHEPWKPDHLTHELLRKKEDVSGRRRVTTVVPETQFRVILLSDAENARPRCFDTVSRTAVMPDYVKADGRALIQVNDAQVENRIECRLKNKAGHQPFALVLGQCKSDLIFVPHSGMDGGVDRKKRQRTPKVWGN